jgi:S-adenosyl-L-methionine hydrolase (adenosine-forming)
VFLCIVDPGVGGDRTPVVLTVDERHFVGPDNGLFELVIRQARSPCTCQEISWIPASLSETFHGRDLFAPVAARLARGLPVEFAADDIAVSLHLDWPDDLAQIVHIDRYGNAVTGFRAAALSSGATLVVGPHHITGAQTFSDVPPSGTFWYNNSNGLVEISVNLGRADRTLVDRF